MRRVVITGMGLVTPLGIGIEENWSRLLDSQSGIRAIERFDVSDLPAKIAGVVPEGPAAKGLFTADEWVEPKEQRKIDRFIMLGMAAAAQAVADSGWVPGDDEEKARTGVMIGSGIGGLQQIYDNSVKLHEAGPRRISPFFIPAALINLISGQVSIKFGFRGPNHSVVTACSTGARRFGSCGR
jgi:3-oxoacyl-[acyl-carrier-protein] synthase II